MDQEFERNKALGGRLGCWKGSYLVEDDAGSVRKALQALKGAPEQSPQTEAGTDGKQAEGNGVEGMQS